MKQIEFLRDIAGRAKLLSTWTHDLSTARELRVLGEKIKEAVNELEAELRKQSPTADRRLERSF
jgi:hypothetical protein